jgi:hypothetical protein
MSKLSKKQYCYIHKNLLFDTKLYQKGENMETTHEINREITRNIKILHESQKQEVLKFIEYLQIKENSSFIEYINERTHQAVEARNKGIPFTSLEELQREYA